MSDSIVQYVAHTYTLHSGCFSWQACTQSTCTIVMVIKVGYFLTQFTKHESKAANNIRNLTQSHEY